MFNTQPYAYSLSSQNFCVLGLMDWSFTEILGVIIIGILFECAYCIFQILQNKGIL